MVPCVRFWSKFLAGQKFCMMPCESSPRFYFLFQKLLNRRSVPIIGAKPPHGLVRRESSHSKTVTRVIVLITLRTLLFS